MALIYTNNVYMQPLVARSTNAIHALSNLIISAMELKEFTFQIELIYIESKVQGHFYMCIYDVKLLKLFEV